MSRVPDFFIVGHPKCGTTALYHSLRQHPEIYMPDMKEPQFFADELRSNAPPWGLPTTLDGYLDLFDGAQSWQRVGEASSAYLWSRVAADNIAELKPDARIIAFLREPAAFLRSVHAESLRARFEVETSFREALALEEQRRLGRRRPRNGHWPSLLLYSDFVQYTEQLRRYRSVFPPEQICVLIYDDYRRDNAGTIRTILRFLGVDDAYPIEPAEANLSARTRTSVDNVVRHVAEGRHGFKLAKAAIQRVTSERIRRGSVQAIRRRFVYADPPPPDEELMAELRRRFKPEVVAVSEYLGRDFVKLWGYDEIQ